VLLLVGCLCVSCSQNQKSEDREHAEDAKQKVKTAATQTREAVEQLAHKAKQKSDKLAADMQSALKGNRSDSDQTSDTVQTAHDKAGRVGERLRTEADHLALKAKVKSKLANEVGLNTVTGVDVDTAGQVVTLSGVVPTAEDKHRAETAVASMPGVHRVVDNLQVRAH
jgi:osmotically-inducible protein OsmY